MQWMGVTCVGRLVGIVRCTRLPRHGGQVDVVCVGVCKCLQVIDVCVCVLYLMVSVEGKKLIIIIIIITIIIIIIIEIINK